MKIHSNLTVFTVLLGLTLISAFAASNQSGILIIFILLLAFIKFVGVAYYFMELRIAHSFWRFIVIGLAFLLMLLVGLII